MTQMQGIVSILPSDNPKNTTRAASLRRTLSADMSSKKLLMKKIAIDSSESAQEECQPTENRGQIDIWMAIISQKTQDDSGTKLPPSYVHPLVKKSASSLSEKSLKVCTESLGSETGSDVVLSSNPTSKNNNNHQKLKQNEENKVERKVVKHAHACLTANRFHPTRFLPPPLQSLAAVHADGPSVHMQSRRVNGRLVVEVVSVSPQKYFEAQRQDGRFLLTLIDDVKQQPSQHDLEEQIPQHHDNHKDKKEHENKETNGIDKDTGIFLNEPPLNSTTKVQKYSTVMIKRVMLRDNENPTWSKKLEVVEAQVITQSPQPIPASGLPPLPRPTSMNSYEYFWRAKPTVASVIDPLMTQHQPPTKTKDLVLLRDNKADCLLSSLKGCKEPRMSHLMWEPFRVATS